MKNSLVIAVATTLGLLLSAPLRGDEVPLEKVKAALAKALPLIEKSAVTYTEYRSCFSCHHQAMPALALTEAKKRGWEIGEDNLKEIIDFTADSLRRGEKNYRKGQGQGGRVTTAGYALLALEVGEWKADSTTEAVVEFLLQADKDLNHWRTTSRRPPSELSHWTSHYLALRGLQAFGTEEQKERIAERIEKVRPWVIETKPKETEDHVFRLWSLHGLQAERKHIKQAVKDILQQQREDGGWAQLNDMDSDAYATGSVLTVLHQAGGVSVKESAYQRGLKFLLDKQLEDGSWHVKSRSKPFQKYFESGFPHEKDQWISMAASSWAAVALLQACPPEKKSPVKSASQKAK